MPGPLSQTCERQSTIGVISSKGPGARKLYAKTHGVPEHYSVLNTESIVEHPLWNSYY